MVAAEREREGARARGGGAPGAAPAGRGRSPSRSPSPGQGHRARGRSRERSPGPRAPAGGVPGGGGGAPLPAPGPFASGAAAGAAALLLENLVPIEMLRSEEERRFLGEDVEAEAREHGEVLETAVPEPPPGSEASGRESARAYLLFRNADCRDAALRALHGRTFDGNRVAASPVGIEHWEAAKGGGWPRLEAARVLAGPRAPVLGGGPHCGAGGPMAGGLLRVRGLPFSASKTDLLLFFGDCGEIAEADVCIVLNPEGRPSGEAFVTFVPGRSHLSLALQKNRMCLPGSSRYLELFPASSDEPQRRQALGFTLT